MRGDIAERDCPAVALAAAGSSPVGLASGSEAPPHFAGPPGTERLPSVRLQ